jgi:low temperature requirement protein LtrA
MSDSTLDRIGGGILAAGAAMSTIGYVLGSIDQPGQQITPGYVGTPLYTTFNLLQFFGAGLVLVGLPVLVSSHWRRTPVLVMLGAIGVGLVMLIQGVGNAFVNATIFPALVDAPATRALANSPAPSLMGTLFLVGMAGWILGGPLLGIAVLRAKVVHRWIGVVMLVGTLAGLASFVLPQQLESLGAIIECFALAALGAELLLPTSTARVPLVSAATA